MEQAHKKQSIILHLASWYPNRLITNDGNFIQKQIRAVAEQEENIVLAVYEDPNLKTKRFEIEEQQDAGIRCYLIYHRAVKPKWLKILKKLYYYYIGYKHIQKKYGTPDLLHAHIFLYAGIMAWLLHIRFKIPYVVSEHSSFLIRGKIPGFLKHLLVKVAKNALLVLPVSEIIKEKLLVHGIGKKFEVTGNVVDISIFKPVPKKSSSDSIKFLHISGFTPEKNLDGILEAVSKLGAVRKDFTLTIAGDGNLKTVEKLIKKWNIEENLIQLAGEKTESEVAELMQGSDVFILYSQFETFSVVTAEALACGLPVIISDIPVARIYEQSGGVFKVQKNNPDALAAIMNEMFLQLRFIDPIKLHRFIAERFSNEQIALKLKGIYDQVLGRKA